MELGLCSGNCASTRNTATIIAAALVSRLPLIVGGVVLALALIGAGAWYLLAVGKFFEVEAATAVSLERGRRRCLPVLQATGYVTARRRDRTRRKSPAPLTDVLNEEGDHVKEVGRSSPISTAPRSRRSSTQAKAGIQRANRALLALV